MLLIGAIAIRFWEELRSRSLSAAMAGAVTASATVLRDGKETVTDIKAVAPGDIMLLSAGNLVPGDIRLLEAHNLFLRCAASHLTVQWASQQWGSSRIMAMQALQLGRLVLRRTFSKSCILLSNQYAGKH